ALPRSPNIFCEIDQLLNHFGRRNGISGIARDRLFQPIRKSLGLNDVRLATGGDAGIDQLPKRFEHEFLALQLLYSGQELVRQERNVRAFNPGRLEDVDDLRRDYRTADDLLNGQFALLRANTRAAAAFGQRLATRLEETHLLSNLARLIGG